MMKIKFLSTFMDKQLKNVCGLFWSIPLNNISTKNGHKISASAGATFL